MYPLPLVREVPPQKQILTHAKHATTAACPLFQPYRGLLPPVQPLPAPLMSMTNSGVSRISFRGRVQNIYGKVGLFEWREARGLGACPPRKLLKISTPLEKISTPKNMLTINPPPIPFHFFYLFSFIFQKNQKILGGN